MGNISKHFDFSEFEKSEVAENNKIDNSIVKKDVRDNIKELVFNVLQPLRNAWRAPLHINSGYRSKELNVLIGGSLNSQHMKGEAADVACNRPVELARLLLAKGLPFDQMILYPNFLHISYKKSGENREQVLYDKKYRGEYL